MKNLEHLKSSDRTSVDGLPISLGEPQVSNGESDAENPLWEEPIRLP